jgi:hypothetical protein
LLPYKREWQALANQLPAGSILILHSHTPARPRDHLSCIAQQLRSRGRSVTTISADRFG